MRYVLIFWAVPMSLFWGWYYLSFNDINFGMLFFSRALHDFVFDVYASQLGVAPEVLPPMIAKACVVDTFLIAGILAWRRRRQIAEWWRSRNGASRPAVLEAGREPLEG
ncbi:MAG: DUF6105 family protein [Rhizobiaceae bacterium]